MTKISGKVQRPPTLPVTLSSKLLNPPPGGSDLQYRPSSRKTTRRRIQSPSTRVKRTGTPAGKRSRPETPFLKWKTVERDDGDGDDDGAGGRGGEFGKEEEEKKSGRRGGRRGRRGRELAVLSARKLAAGLWRLHLPEVGGFGDVGKSVLQRRQDRLGLQAGFESKDIIQSPHSISGPESGFFCKYSNSALEGATKWDPLSPKSLHQIQSQMKTLDQQVSANTTISVLKSDIEQSRLRIQELETERRSSKKKLDQFLRKVSEEKALWRSREHEKIRAFIDDIKAELSRERKIRQRVEILNSKLVNELADIKVSAKRFMQDYEKERKERELIEEVCEELAKEIGEDKGEVEELKRESMNLREEVEDERRMLQMVEVWREERVQMKLVDVKVAVEEKYSQMNKLVLDLENFLVSKNAKNPLDGKEVGEALALKEAASALSIRDIKEFSYQPPNPDDIFAIFEDVNFVEENEREIEQCGDLNNNSNGNNYKDGFVDRINGDHEIEEDESGWETVSNIDQESSSISPEGSVPSVNKNRRVSICSVSGTEWGEENEGRETPINEISEICLGPTKQVKKVSSLAKLWRSRSNNGESYKIISVDGTNGRVSNGRMSNGNGFSLDRKLDRGGGGLSHLGLESQWSSPDRGKKGCIPLSSQKHSLKAKLLEARFESQKVQIRHVLKQKI